MSLALLIEKWRNENNARNFQEEATSEDLFLHMADEAFYGLAPGASYY